MPIEGFDEWIDALRAVLRGQLLLVNVVHDLRTGRLPPDRVGAIAHAMLDAWRVAGRVDSLISACRTLNSVATSNALKGHPPLDSDVACARVTSWKAAEYNILPGSYSTPIEDDISDDRIAELQGRLGDKAYGTMPPRNQIGWVTTEKALREIQANGGVDRTERVREALGLRHRLPRTRLAVFVYPAGTLAGVRFQPPTFVEGDQMTTGVYRSRQGPGSWGEAVDLFTGQSGVCEAVHDQIPVGRDWFLEDVGRLEQDRAPADPYVSIVANAPIPWDTVAREELRAVIVAVAP